MDLHSPLHVAGKLDGPARLNAVAAGHLVHIVDQTSGRRFLVDSGASYSILPYKSAKPAKGPRMHGPSGQLIPCWGEQLQKLQFQGKIFPWSFLLAAVDFPILGVDFLRHYKLMLDISGNSLVDEQGKRFSTLSSSSPPTASVVTGMVRPYSPPAVILPPQATSPLGVQEVVGAVATSARPPQTASPLGVLEAVGAGSLSKASAAAVYRRILDEFPEVECAVKVLPPVAHDVVHHIVTTGPPIATRFRNWMERSWRRPGRSSSSWSGMVLYSGQLHHGPVLSTWYGKQTEAGDRAATSGD